ncbi:hypothetical protein RB10098 [Rhodopirellula baltica SH 1]|uniref:Uncharacterized protein n=1 Tax=Rhodopirellula baltica (strain DSM 10527 / NCIMB 13988 / SH1) TaxID=243090 RepID=Q7UKK8_RHOBA|nr:hypothetical protein RB10098 [Rhodopirellula baltica SH 1]
MNAAPLSKQIGSKRHCCAVKMTSNPLLLEGSSELSYQPRLQQPSEQA